jgi:polar amino acid transport system ATP-binding protein
MPDAPVLQIAGITKSFGPTKALNCVDLVIDSGQVVCVVGPSGCGKSTLLRCVNFLEEPDQGYIYIDGEPMGARAINGRRRRDNETNINRMRSRIGMVFQQFNVWPHLTALDNVVLPQVCVSGRPRDDAIRRARDILTRVALAGKETSFPAELSGGQLQRVAIARALAMEPRIMLLDEPTSALDPENVSEVLAVIKELARAHRTMIVVTHELRFAAQVADRIVFMDAGRVVEDGTPSEVLGQPKSERLQQFMAKVLYARPLASAEN